MFSEIGSFDAKTRLPELLREVAQGERFTITLRGRPVADLVPCEASSRVSAKQAVAQMQAFKRVRLTADQDVKEWITQGRR